MADFLSSLAGGLRAAGGVLNPSVLQANEREQILQQQQQQRTRDLITAQILRAAEGGAIDPAQASQVLQQQGINMPSGVVGPSAETQARQQALKNEQAFRTEIDSLQDRTPESIAKIAMKYGKPEIAVSLYNAQEQRAARMQTAADAIAERQRQADLRHEEALARAADQRQRDIENERYRRDRLQSDAQFKALQIELTRMGLELRREMQQNRQEKPLPATAAQKIADNEQNLRRAQQALDLMEGKKVGVMEGDQNATGLKGFLPDAVLQRVDPKGVDARAAIGDLGSLVIHDRSGAAVTASEFPRLQPFIPSPKDDPETVKKKLKRFVQVYKETSDGVKDVYRESGFRVPDSSQTNSDAKPVKITSDAEYKALPSGAEYIAPDGSIRKKK
jgi:hypothetical protein